MWYLLSCLVLTIRCHMNGTYSRYLPIYLDYFKLAKSVKSFASSTAECSGEVEASHIPLRHTAQAASTLSFAI